MSTASASFKGPYLLDNEQTGELRETLETLVRSPIGDTRMRRFRFKFGKGEDWTRLSDEDLDGRPLVAFSFSDDKGWHEFIFAPYENGAYAPDLIDLPRASALLKLLRPLAAEADDTIGRHGRASVTRLSKALDYYEGAVDDLGEMFANVPADGKAWTMPPWSPDDKAFYVFIPR